MALESRNITYRDRWYGYGRPCGTPYYNRKVTNGTLVGYEYVESYRGQPETIKVGSKDRKVFHYFMRAKSLVSAKNAMYWCPPSGFTMFAEDYPMLPLAWFCDNPQLFETDGRGTLPYMGARCNALGEELREFAIRDVFMKAVSPRFEGAVFLAELDELLVGILKLLRGSFLTLTRRGHGVKTLRNIVMNPHELWLWWRYALMPAMLDAEDLITALKPDRMIDRVQDGSRIERTKISGLAEQDWSPYGWLPIQWECYFKTGVGSALDILKRFDPAPWGTSSWDVIRATWERIPFSFIFDWFVNVGDWLTSLRSLEIVYAQSYATYAVESRTYISAGANQTLTNGQWCDSFRMERIIDLEPPSNPLIDRRWRNCLRTIDLISLTIGMLKGILKQRRN